ncbi:MAG: hypothetical protein IAE64_06820 [Flavobacteriales bacterium]|nr:hypothetical protein [Flavobacteriales bacterium]
MITTVDMTVVKLLEVCIPSEPLPSMTIGRGWSNNPILNNRSGDCKPRS